MSISINAVTPYDLVILNGRIIDPETKYDKVAHLGIKDGKITNISSEMLVAEKTIDATGLVVAPGFIHTNVPSLLNPLIQKQLIQDGVTTALDLERGAYPVNTWYDAATKIAYLNYGACVDSIGMRESILIPVTPLL